MKALFVVWIEIYAFFYWLASITLLWSRLWLNYSSLLNGHRSGNVICTNCRSPIISCYHRTVCNQRFHDRPHRCVEQSSKRDRGFAIFMYSSCSKHVVCTTCRPISEKPVVTFTKLFAGLDLLFTPKTWCNLAICRNETALTGLLLSFFPCEKYLKTQPAPHFWPFKEIVLGARTLYTQSVDYPREMRKTFWLLFI